VPLIGTQGFGQETIGEVQLHKWVNLDLDGRAHSESQHLSLAMKVRRKQAVEGAGFRAQCAAYGSRTL
jgi:hypothetical protein